MKTLQACHIPTGAIFWEACPISLEGIEPDDCLTRREALEELLDFIDRVGPEDFDFVDVDGCRELLAVW